MTTDFVDISHHNANVDLAAYKAAGYTRIVLKATEGTGFDDPMFAARWREAGRLGLKRVAYHFARAKFDGAAEFAHFYAVVKAAGGFTKNDMACLDVEDTDTPDQAAAEMRAFTKAAVAKGVRNGIIYTYNWYAVHHAISPSQLPAGWRRLWLADYTVGQADRNIELGAGWTWAQVVARQFTDKAQVPGIGSTDDSHFIHEWLTAVDAVSTTTEDWFDMATQADLEAAVRKVLNEGTGKGQPNWAQTEEAILATAQAVVNKLGDLGYLLSYGDNADDSQDAGTHPNNFQRIRFEMAQDRAAVAAQFAALMEAMKTATGGVVDLSAVEAAAEKGAADALSRVELSVAPEAAA